MLELPSHGGLEMRSAQCPMPSPCDPSPQLGAHDSCEPSGRLPWPFRMPVTGFRQYTLSGIGRFAPRMLGPGARSAQARTGMVVQRTALEWYRSQ